MLDGRPCHPAYKSLICLCDRKNTNRWEQYCDVKFCVYISLRDVLLTVRLSTYTCSCQIISMWTCIPRQLAHIFKQITAQPRTEGELTREQSLSCLVDPRATAKRNTREEKMTKWLGLVFLCLVLPPAWYSCVEAENIAKGNIGSTMKSTD